MEENSPSVGRQEKETESSDPENTTTKKVKLVPDTDGIAPSAQRATRDQVTGVPVLSQDAWVPAVWGVFETPPVAP